MSVNRGQHARSIYRSLVQDLANTLTALSVMLQIQLSNVISTIRTTRDPLGNMTQMKEMNMSSEFADANQRIIRQVMAFRQNQIPDIWHCRNYSFHRSIREMNQSRHIQIPDMFKHPIRQRRNSRKDIGFTLG